MSDGPPILLCTFVASGAEPRAGLVAGDRIVDLTLPLGGAGGGGNGGRPGDLRALIERIPLDDLAARLRDLAAAPGDAPTLARADVRLLAPVPGPPKVTAVGLNYRDHAAETGRALPERPMLFAKARTAVSGPEDPIRLPYRGAEKVDYEVELGLVVGRAGFRIPAERAREHLLGYTVAIDVSDREAQYGDKQFYRGKSYPTFCPVGPFVALEGTFAPAGVALTTHLNGQEMQRGTTADLIFSIDAVIAYISAVTPLEPGDLILTGTPAGVGFARNPPVFLRAGDRLRCAVEGIGALDLPVEGPLA